MTAASEHKACNACAKAKRKCGKQSPSCQRCTVRGYECQYPLPKTTCFVPLEHSSVAENYQDGSVDSTPPVLDLDLDIILPSQNTSITHPSAVWFLSPETWEVDHRPVGLSDDRPTNTADAKSCIATIHCWLEAWVRTGSIPYIHSRLYATQLPACVQVAFTVLTSYIYRNDANTEVILRILNDRASALLLENNVSLGDLGLAGDSVDLEPSDVLGHLSRVHALIVYQKIGLFDGDIRSRHLAEGRIQLLDCWAKQMVEFASRNLCHLNSNLDLLELTGSDCQFTPTRGPKSLWKTWILAESVRRTWLIARGMQSIYLFLQQGWAFCPGSLMVTTRCGIWEADSAWEWEYLCSKSDVGFTHRLDSQRLLTQAKPEDVDEFAILFLKTTFGESMVKRWMLESNAS